ncbi:hypothetical protein [Oceanivirga salmonicida]|nr:hypothetical protein [Oceanivirga salmonicida]
MGVRYDVYIKRNGMYIGNEFSIPLGITFNKVPNRNLKIGIPIPMNIKTHIGKKFENGLKVGAYIAIGSKGIIGLEVAKTF